jgi:serine/threonine protein kinase
MTQPLGIKNLP